MIASFKPLVLGMLIAVPAAAVYAQVPKPEPKTVEAVVHADDAWGDAEVRGDGGYLEQLLLPGYVSVGVAGKATTRETIIAKARERGASKAYADQVAAWKKAHPSHPEVTIAGDTAVLTWRVGRDGGDIASCDVFVYRDGRWRALYSQHSAAQEHAKAS